MLPGRDQTLPPLSQLLAGRYEERDLPSIECVPKPPSMPAHPVTARLALKIVSCNVQTLRDKKPLVSQQLVDMKVNITGLQETRMGHNSEINGAAFFEFFSAASNGEGGCALLFSRLVPYAWQGLQPLFFQRSHFTCVHSSHRHLAVRVKAPFLDLLVIAAHAPQSGCGAPAVEAWWRDLQQAPWLRPFHGRTVACMDANAQLGSVETPQVGCHAGTIETPAGAALREWLQLAQAYLPSTFFDAQGRCIPGAQEPTWFSPSGYGYRIDYIALPFAWAADPCRPSVLRDFELLNKDHLPVLVEVSRCIVGLPPAKAHQTVPPSFVKDPDAWPQQSVQAVKTGLQQLQSAPWHINVHDHMHNLLQSVSQIGRQARPRGRKPCRPFITEHTRGILERSKQCKKWLRLLDGLKAHLASPGLGGTPLSPEGWSRSDIGSMLESARGTYKALQASLRRAVAHDKSAFTRHAHDRLLSAADPYSAKDFFRALRALRPPGKKVLKPFASLKLALDPEATMDDRLAAQQEHFARLEAGEACRPEDLCLDVPTSAPEASFSIADLPTLLDMETSIRAFKKGKAPGPEGIPDWVWTLNTAHSAKLLFPVCLKTHVRLSEPISCKATCLISLFKGKGSPSLVSNHRAIALMCGPGKLFRKQMRPALLKALPRSDFLQGGLPGSLHAPRPAPHCARARHFGAGHASFSGLHLHRCCQCLLPGRSTIFRPWHLQRCGGLPGFGAPGSVPSLLPYCLPVARWH